MDRKGGGHCLLSFSHALSLSPSFSPTSASLCSSVALSVLCRGVPFLLYLCTNSAEHFSLSLPVILCETLLLHFPSRSLFRMAVPQCPAHSSMDGKDSASLLPLLLAGPHTPGVPPLRVATAPHSSWSLSPSWSAAPGLLLHS